MKINSVEPAGAIWRPGDSFPTDLPQVAFAGRSNVGKSSLLNRLMGRKRLAPTSQTPGKTRKLHFYRINGRFYMVDLPGYGFAHLPLEVRQKWQQLTEGFLEGNPALRGVVSLVDIRREPTVLDRQLLAYLGSRKIPVVIALTKADKLGSSRVSQAVDQLVRALNGAVDPEMVIPTSAETGLGCPELLGAIAGLIFQTAAADPPPSA